MVAVGLCGSDLHGVIRGEWPRPTPMVLGHEGAGVVEAVGERCRGRFARATASCSRGRPSVRCVRPGLPARPASSLSPGFGR